MSSSRRKIPESAPRPAAPNGSGKLDLEHQGLVVQLIPALVAVLELPGVHSAVLGDEVVVAEDKDVVCLVVNLVRFGGDDCDAFPFLVLYGGR